MKAQELRIGNIVLDEYLEEVYVISICKEGLEVSYSGDNDESTKYLDISEIEPIPLTKEWLLKLGFVRTFKGCYKPMPVVKGEIHFEKIGKGYVCVLYCSTGALIPNDIKHVHQLQNLYFALTGEEITI